MKAFAKNKIRIITIAALICAVTVFFTSCSPGSLIGLSAKSDDEIYDAIYESLSNGEDGIEIIGADPENVGKVYDSVLEDHPEIFWVSHSYTYKIFSLGSIKSMHIQYYVDESLKEKEDEVNAAVERIISNMKPGGSPYEQVIQIHDYLVRHTEYDDEAYSLISKNKDRQKIFNASTVYGCLCEGKAVCSGYSAAFQLLLQSLGIESGRISGEDPEGGNHQWNYLKLDDGYYYADVTWDDNATVSEVIAYDYFCITEDELVKTHRIGENRFIPECVSTEYDYYIYHDMYLNKYNYNDAAAILNKSGGTIKFSDKEETDKAVNDLIKKQKIYNIVSSGRISYFTGKAGNILHIIAG